MIDPGLFTSNTRKKLALVFAAASAAITGPAWSADPGRMVIKNDSKAYVSYYVPQDDYWNCDDAPKPGFLIASVAPGAETSPFEFLRTDGHGCNGRQGQFTMIPTLPNVPAQGQHFWYDSHGALELQPPQVTNYLSVVKQRGDGVYVWTVTPTQ